MFVQSGGWSLRGERLSSLVSGCLRPQGPETVFSSFGLPLVASTLDSIKLRPALKPPKFR